MKEKVNVLYYFSTNSKFSNNISKWNTRNVKLKSLCFEGCPLEKKPEFKSIFKN